MKYMNDYDLEMAFERAAPASYRKLAAKFLINFAATINQCSDGWAYWQAPRKAAQQMMAIAEGGNHTTEDYNKALGAIKAFVTRQAKKGNNIPVDFHIFL